MEKERKAPSESATLYKTGTKKTGNDGNKWIIVETKNNIKRWKLYKKSSVEIKPLKKSSVEIKPLKKQNKISIGDFHNLKPVSENQLNKIIDKDNFIYNTLKKKIFPKLNLIGFKTYIIPLPLSENGIYSGDYAFDYIREKHGSDFIEENFMYFTFMLTKGNKPEFTYKPINIGYTPLTLKNKKKVIDIFNEYLNDYYEWSGSNTKNMIIHFEKIKNKINIKN